MATIKAEELRAKTADELKTQLVELKKEQFNLRFQVAKTHHGRALCAVKLPVLKLFLASRPAPQSKESKLCQSVLCKAL